MESDDRHGHSMMYIGIDEAGTFKLRCKLKKGYTDPTSLETITDADITSISCALEPEQANKIIVHGFLIKKHCNLVTLWNAAAAGCFEEGGGDLISETIQDGQGWPDDVVLSETKETRGEFWAKYGDV